MDSPFLLVLEYVTLYQPDGGSSPRRLTSKLKVSLSHPKSWLIFYHCGTSAVALAFSQILTAIRQPTIVNSKI